MRRDVRRWTPATVDERHSRLGQARSLRVFDWISYHAG